MRSDLITIQNNEVSYVAGDGRAIEEAVRLACIRLGKHEAGLFARGADADFPQRWNAWMVDEWPRYEVCLHRAYRAAVDFKFEGILQADADLSALLSANQDARDRSLALAQIIVDSTSGAKGRSLLDRFQTAMNAGGCEGHGLTAFGLHMVLFHVPLLPATVAYLYDEWRSAVEECELRGRETSIEAFFSRYPHLIQQVQHRLNQEPQPLQVVRHG